jgi:undecaprenyl-diphosphatase
VTDLYQQINDFARTSGWLHAPMTDYAKFGVVAFAGLLLVGWWLARRRPAETMAAALLAPLSTVLAVAVNQPIIRAVGEARPYVAHPDAQVLVAKTGDPSFPSDHAAMAGAVAAGLVLVSWRLGLVAAAFAMVMAFDRVYVGVHYPQDVVAGLALGAAVAILVWVALRRPVTRLVVWGRATQLAPLLGTHDADADADADAASAGAPA